MTDPQDDFETICQSACPATAVGRLSAFDLRSLHSWCQRTEASNGRPGGILGIVRHLAVAEAADRFFASPEARPS